MSNLLPVKWKESVDRARDNVMGFFTRWLPAHLPHSGSSDEDFRMPSLIAHGGPAVDVTEEDDMVRVTAEMPGLDEKDITVGIAGNHLTIQGEKNASREEKDRDYYYQERSYGSFSRVVTLPCEVDNTKAKAKYQNGVLKISLPKTHAARPRHVNLKVT
ncbi:MAG: Hsp20/alpha crystallin family protein [Candidatus Hydrogenedentes bacterium]|nr:Hsp20/alpha crystallin family protein [Candidatus Hydrogenedentota bacterium]